MKTSIIIPHLNTLEYLISCINSIRQNTNDYEIIVVDNGTNENKELLKHFLEHSNVKKIIYNDTNLGFSKANNQGAKIAEGEYLCFLNSDTIVKKGWLEELYKTLDSHNNCGAVGPLGNPKSSIINGNEIFFNQYRGQYRKDRKVDMLIGFCILISKKLFNDIGCWDEDFKIGNFEDNYLSYKIFSKGYELWISSKSKVLHRKPGRTFYANNINWAESMEYNQEIIKNKIKLLKT